MKFTKILWPGEGGHSLFDECIKKPLTEYLENHAVLVAEDDLFIKAGNAISIGEEVSGRIKKIDVDASIVP